MIRWTAEELEEMRRADEEIEAEFRLTADDLRRQRADDRAAKLAALPNDKKAIAEYRRAYYEQNREAIAEKQRWIADARKEKGYSQTALAEICSCSQSTISLLEQWKLKLSQCAQRDAICWRLKGMDYEDLMAQGV